MQYQTKWVRNMLKLFSSGSSSLRRTFLLAGLILGSLGVAIASQQLSLANVGAATTPSKYDGYAPNVAIKIASHIDQRKVTYTLTIRNAAHSGLIRKKIPILFTDIIPKGLSNIRATGDHWDTTVRTTAHLMVTGTYRGSYPVLSNTTLPAITITATITSGAGNMLTNSAAVQVQGNSDQIHNKAVVHDKIGFTSPSELSLHKDSSTCASNCSNQNSSTCASNCSSQNNSTCASDFSNQNNNTCASDFSNQNNSTCASNNDQISNNQCDQQSVYTSVQRSVRISAQESVNTSCECDQQNTSNGNNSQTSSSNISPNLSPSTNSDPHRSPGKGSADPFPALPNTGSDPLLMQTWD
jgi:uncharacterized repeat protein (TIGR01451 family)